MRGRESGRERPFLQRRAFTNASRLFGLDEAATIRSRWNAIARYRARSGVIASFPRALMTRSAGRTARLEPFPDLSVGMNPQAVRALALGHDVFRPAHASASRLGRTRSGTAQVKPPGEPPPRSGRMR